MKKGDLNQSPFLYILSGKILMALDIVIFPPTKTNSYDLQSLYKVLYKVFKSLQSLMIKVPESLQKLYDQSPQ